MIDLHCHYLPGVDDGPEDHDVALELVRAAAANGISTAVVTPHVLARRWENTRSSLLPAFESFEQSVRDAGIAITLRLGAEIRLEPESLDLLDAGELPSLGAWQGNAVYLIELPDAGIPVGTMKVVEHLLSRGAVPMIAHPERNKEVMRSPARIEPLVRAGCLLQLTAASVCGWFGRPAHRTSLTLLDEGWVTAVATDAHNLLHRPPVLAEARHALRIRYGDTAATALTEGNPALVIGG